MRLKSVRKLSGIEIDALLSEGKSFALYVRSEKDEGVVKEMFDVDIVFPELAKTFGEKLLFCYCDIEDLGKRAKELGVLFSPTVLFFKEGRLHRKLEGIRSWAEYTRAVEELLCS